MVGNRTIYKVWLELQRCELDEDGFPEDGCEDVLREAELVAEFESKEAVDDYLAKIRSLADSTGAGVS